MITSPHNDKLKLIRRLGRRRSRERDGLFVGEGEDLLPAARAPRPAPGGALAGAGGGRAGGEGEALPPPAGAPGQEPVELLTAAGEGLGGTEVEPALLARFS